MRLKHSLRLVLALGGFAILSFACTAGSQTVTHHGDEGTGAGNGSDASSNATGDGTETSLPPESSDPDGPQLLSFGASSTSLTEGESLSISAIFAAKEGDAGGPSVAGGALLDDTSGATVATFRAVTGTSGYEATVSWSQLQASTPSAFAKGGNDKRTLRARFFDAAGRKTERSLTVTLTCDGAAACDGKCTNTDTDRNNCGACANACPKVEGNQTACNAGKCAPPVPVE